MRKCFQFVCLFAIAQSGAFAQEKDDFPIVPADMDVSLFAKEPLVRNPCALTFDSNGRLCVGMGPQYRTPKPDTPGDSVWILVDENQDGKADSRIEFATGFNAIQGLAWKGRDLWIANAPDLTVVRDLDGDDKADEYERVYTDLGNLEHALHGLNFGPDGKLYMSKGNSKGLTELPDRVAPKPFRELWGIETPSGTPDMPVPVTYSPDNYQKNYHDPRDDWGVCGGILRCDDDGLNLEIVCRGFRNPWDITFDDTFTWLGTDNDQTMGDKIFSPFYGAHFGWGHSWSYDWKGDNHLPTTPSSGPLFEGSGAGVVFCGIDRYPNKYRNIFLINDWLQREVSIYRPHWDGAWMKPESESMDLLAHAGGGRSMPLSTGRAFDPVDIELGPDGAIWIGSWGRQYGAKYENEKLTNEGRIYRLWPKEAPPLPYKNSKRDKPISEWTSAELIEDLGSHLPVWRCNAQDELIRRGESIRDDLLTALQKNPSQQLETWITWTLGRIDPSLAWFEGNPNQRIQSLRIQATLGRPREEVRSALTDPEPRIRLEAILTARQTGMTDWSDDIVSLAARETDRIVFYAAWGAMTELLSVSDRKALLNDSHDQVRLAALLSLLEKDALNDKEIEPLTSDKYTPTAAIAKKRLSGKDEFEQRGRPLSATGAITPNEPTVIPFENIAVSSGHSYRAAVLEPGVRLYTDRNYRFSSIPIELMRETFIQTACSDAEAQKGLSLSFDLTYPATVFLIDDARAEDLPKWAREKWQKTNLEVSADDPKKMRVYQADFAAGPVTFGPNRMGVEARKGNYLIAVRPKLLSPDGSIATTESILTQIPSADPKRGRDLFFSRQGANCASCHQVGSIGNNHAPSLSDIAGRADARTIVESIIDPSANIVEGFAANAISTKKGKSYSGIILEETGQHVRMALMGGTTVTIPRREIAGREGLPVSAMPASFNAMLTSEQIADIVSFLLLQKPGFSFRSDNSKLHLLFDGERIATYLLDDPKLTRRAFVNVRTPSGLPVTRNFPPRKPEDLDPGYRGEDEIIHPVMHPGIWMSFGWISDNDYWRLESRVEFDSFLAKPTATEARASFTTRDRYLDKTGKETVCIQDTTYDFVRVAKGIRLDWDSVFYNDERDFSFGDQEESGLAFRIASPLRVQGGNGQIVNNRGEKNGTGTWGKEFEWIEYSGSIGERNVGLRITPHPENPRHCWSHSRDYGVVVSNPFQKQPKERREPYVTTTVKKGERYRLRYSILIFEE